MTQKVIYRVNGSIPVCISGGFKGGGEKREKIAKGGEKCSHSHTQRILIDYGQNTKPRVGVCALYRIQIIYLFGMSRSSELWPGLLNRIQINY